MEIDENLARAELTASQEAKHILRRKEIWEEKHGNTGGITPSIPRGRGQPKQFAAELASIMPGAGSTETAKREVDRKIKRAEVLGEDIDKIEGTSLDKVAEMDALIKLPEPERAALVERPE